MSTKGELYKGERKQNGECRSRWREEEPTAASSAEQCKTGDTEVSTANVRAETSRKKCLVWFGLV